MKHLLFVCFILCWGASLFCQTGKITGSVLDADNKTALELATVSVFGKDSSLITYQLSDKNGKFTVEKLPLKRNLLVSVTYAGYTTYYTSIQLESGRMDTLNVYLILNNGDTNGVVVTSRVPVRMNGDTLEINPSAFTMKEDAVVEELLSQVPSITIWSDGSITLYGKKVQTLLVDGKPFMGASDFRVATQNLPKSAIDKIQLYQEYDRRNINKIIQPQDSLLTMNIKLKENSKKGYFGKLGMGYGTRERFESDISFQTYDRRNSIGLGGGINNINRNIGNIQEMFQNSTYRTYNPNLYNVGRFGANGINKSHSFGTVYTHNFIKTTNGRQNNRFDFNYNKSGTNAYLTDKVLQNRTTVDNPQFIVDDGVQNNRNDRHDFGVNYVKTNSYDDNLNMNGVVSSNKEESNSQRYTEVRDTSMQLQSTNSTSETQNNVSDNELLNVTFAKSSLEEPLKSFDIQINTNRSNMDAEKDVNSIFHSITDASKNTSYNRRYFTTNNTFTIGGNLDYPGFKRLLLERYNLFGIDLSFMQGFNYSRVLTNDRVADYDNSSKQYIENGNLSNRNKKEVFQYNPSLAFARSFRKGSATYYRSINAQFKLVNDIKEEKNQSTIDKRNLDRRFNFFRYEGNIILQQIKRNKYVYFLSLEYLKNFEYPTIDQLFNIVDEINVYYIRIGNPNLQNEVNHIVNLRTNFNTQNPSSPYVIGGNLNGEYSRIVNAITDSTINELSGRRIYYYINTDKSNSLNLNSNFNISRRIKRSNLQLMWNGQFRDKTIPNYIDSKYSLSKTNNLSNQFTIQFSLRSILILNLTQASQVYKTHQTGPGLNSFRNTNNSTKFGVTLNYPSNFTFSSTLENIDNSSLTKPTILWNGFVTYRFMKQQGELKFSGTDLLKQFKNIINSVDSYGTSTRITNGLQQFFLLTFSYYPRKFGKTEIKKMETEK